MGMAIKTRTDYIRWDQDKISAREMLESMADLQGGKNLTHRLCQRIGEAEEKESLKLNIPQNKAADLEGNEDDIRLEIPNNLTQKLAYPECNIQLGRLANVRRKTTLRLREKLTTRDVRGR